MNIILLLFEIFNINAVVYLIDDWLLYIDRKEKNQYMYQWFKFSSVIELEKKWDTK